MSVIAVLVSDGVPAHQLTTPGMVFTCAASALPEVAYEVRICSATGSVTTGEPALGFTTPWGLEGLADADTVLVTGRAAFREPPPTETADALRACAERGCRMAAIGTGTFLLASTGLLDGRRATTAWPHSPELADLHPRVEVVPVGTPSVEDGRFITSSGVFGGLDLCIDLIDLDHGEQAAATTMRRLVMPLHDSAVADREEREREIADRTDLGPTRAWLEANLHRQLTLADMAAHARVSVSSLTRRFRAQTGLPPLQYLLRARLHQAQLLLENTDTPVEQIAVQTGFGSPANLRHHFHRMTGTTPRTYRSAFQGFAAVVSKQSPPQDGDAEGGEGGGGAAPGGAGGAGLP